MNIVEGILRLLKDILTKCEKKRIFCRNKLKIGSGGQGRASRDNEEYQKKGKITTTLILIGK